jgi:hypothetical protein
MFAIHVAPYLMENISSSFAKGKVGLSVIPLSLVSKFTVHYQEHILLYVMRAVAGVSMFVTSLNSFQFSHFICITLQDVTCRILHGILLHESSVISIFLFGFEITSKLIFLIWLQYCPDCLNILLQLKNLGNSN